MAQPLASLSLSGTQGNVLYLPSIQFLYAHIGNVCTHIIHCNYYSVKHLSHKFKVLSALLSVQEG